MPFLKEHEISPPDFFIIPKFQEGDFSNKSAVILLSIIAEFTPLALKWQNRGNAIG